MLDEAIILAGGLGSRLANVISDVPKPMAPVHDVPFLDYVLEHLESQGIRHVVLAVGYKHESIRKRYTDKWAGMEISYAIEHKPLGTGGALKNAAGLCRSSDVCVLNGDTLFRISLHSLYQFYRETNADIALALKEMNDFDRYGTVETDDTGRVRSFHEKKPVQKGLVNAGVYILNPDFLSTIPQDAFSFEKRILEEGTNRFRLYGLPLQGYFIDIGIPEDLNKAREELVLFSTLPEQLRDWTLFLDRDGVMNHRIPGDYVRSPNAFRWKRGSLAAAVQLSNFFKYTFIVSNQQGIGKGLMTEDDLAAVHHRMMSDLQNEGGRLTAVYHCPELEIHNPKCRKPNTGMALQAKREFPDIRFEQSVIIGDSLSDIEFGQKLGMKTIFIKGKDDVQELQELPDLQVDSLADAARNLHRLFG